METSAIIGIVIGLIDKILDQIPDVKERREKEWIELKKLYLEEINKPIENRDANKILNIRDAIMSVGKEVSK